MKKLERLGKGIIDRVLGLVRGPATTGIRIDPGQVREVLVVRPHNQMGDMLLSTPMFSALRRGFPKARITLMASPDNYEIMIAHPDVDRCLVFEKKKFRTRPGDLLGFWRSLRGTRWDVVIMPTTVSFSVTSCIIAWLAGGRVRIGCDGRAYGRSLGKAVFHIHVPCVWTAEHQTERNLDFTRAAGVTVQSREPVMGLRDEERCWARAELELLRNEGQRLIGIHLGAGKIPNRWPVERFARIAAALAGSPANRVMVMVGPREEPLVEEIRDHIPNEVMVVSGLSLRQASAFIGELDFFLCNDTGVMHIGAALSTPTLALFGPTDPRLWAPLSPALHWLRGEGNRMDSLSVEQVQGKLQEILVSLNNPGSSAGECDHASECSSS
ncbi:MAG: glycosyltransferase family 9 protein [Candidatus Eisenbacteria sp.]|nr:glycosyltransferase family 9 protein [Candidatus Eisenbacteria bacterium]